MRNRTRLHLFPPTDQIAYLGLITAAPLVLPDADRISPLEAAARTALRGRKKPRRSANGSAPVRNW